MLTRHPYRALLSVLAVTVLGFVVSGLVGQYGDGPLGGALPSWVGDVAWATFLLGALTLVLLVSYLGVAALVSSRRRPT